MASRLVALCIFGVISVPGDISGRITQAWTYQEIFDKADLVVIARATATTETSERSTLRDIEPPVPVIGVMTEFETRLRLKGPVINKFQLHHYRFESADAMLRVNAPLLIRVDIKPGREQYFLLFLVKESDGRYTPVGGQTDPAITSVLEIPGE